MATNRIVLTVDVNDKGGIELIGQKSEKAANSLNKVATSAHSTDRALKGASEQSSNTTKNFSKMSQGISGPVVRAYATLAANLFAVSAAFKFFERAADYGSMMQAHSNFAASMGTSLNTITGTLQRASKGMLDYAGAAKMSGLAVAAGLNIKQLEDYANSARSIADVLGEEYETTLKRLVKATASGRTTLLREIGVTVDAQIAKERYGDSIGKAASQLTEFQQKQALITETQRQLNITFGDTAASANPFTILLATVKDIVTNMTQGLLPVFEGVAAVLSNSLYGVLTILATFSISVLKTAVPVEALKAKFAGWQASATAASIKASSELKKLSMDVKDLTVDYQGLKDGATLALGDIAQKAISAGAKTSVSLQKLASGKGGVGAIRTAVTAAMRQIDQVTGKIKGTGLFAGMSAALVREFDQGFKQLDILARDHAELQKVKASKVRRYWGQTYAWVKKQGVNAFTAVTKAAERLSSIAFKIMRVLSGFGIATILIQAFSSIKANILDIALRAVGLLEAVLGPITNAFEKVLSKIKGAGSSEASLLAQLETQRELAAAGSEAAAWNIFVIEKKIADIREGTRHNIYEEARNTLLNSALATWQATQREADLLKAHLAEIKSLIEANAKDILAFSSSLSNASLDPLEASLVRLNALGSLSQSTVLEKIIGLEEGTEKQILLRDFTKNLENLASISKDPALSALATSLSMPGANIPEIIQDMKGMESVALEITTTFTSLSQEIESFSWDNLSSGNFKELLSSLTELDKKQTKLINLSNKYGQTAVASSVAALANYKYMIAEVSKLVQVEHELTLQKMYQDELLASMQGMDSETSKNARDLINIRKSELEVSDSLNKIRGIDLQLAEESANLSDVQKQDLIRSRDILQQQVAIETQKIKRMEDQLVIQAQIRSIQSDTQYLSIAGELLNLTEQRFKVESDIARTQFENRKKAAEAAAGPKGLSRSAEIKFAQEAAKLEVEAAEQAIGMKETMINLEFKLLDAQFELFKLELEAKNVENDLVTRLVEAQGAVNDARRGLIKEELELEKIKLKGLEQGASSRGMIGGAEYSGGMYDILVDLERISEGDFGVIFAEDKLSAQLGYLEAFTSSSLETLKQISPEGELYASIINAPLQIALAWEQAVERIKETSNKIEQAAAVLNAVGQTMGQIGAIAAASSNAKISGIDKEIEAEKKRDGKSKDSLARIQAMEQRKEKMQRKAFEQNKKFQMANAALAGGAAIMSAFSTQPFFPTGIVMGTLATALVAAQLAAIASTSYSGGSSAASVGGATKVSMGERSNTVDLAKAKSPSGELAYARGESGVGSGMTNFTPAFTGTKHRAAGGATTAYMVGEQGPELFIPDRPGTIAPADDTASMNSAVNVNFNINAVDASGVEDLLFVQRGNIIRMIREAANQHGEFFLEAVSEGSLT